MRRSLLLHLIFLISSINSSEIIVRFILKDDIKANTDLGNISDKSSSIPPPTSSAGYYRVVTEPNRFTESFFNVNRQTTMLSTKTTVDRDDICSKLSCCARVQCHTNLTVFIGLTQSQSLKVVVQLVFNDENDNTPVIDSGTISMPESTAVGSTKPLPMATDRDSLANGVKEYRLSDPTGTFKLIMKDKRPFLKVVRKLDADNPRVRSFSLPYSAIDGGSPAKTGQVTLEVRIEDENDNTPIFEVSSRTKWIDEDLPVGSAVFQFKATDADYMPDNKRISYRLDETRSTPQSLASKRFEVNSVTGAVTVRSKLDYDNPTERRFALVVEARDHGSPARSATGSLSIVLRNVNDNDPQISVTASKPLVEEEPPGIRVRTISVSDPDDSISSIGVNCSLSNSPGFAIRSITENHYFDIVTTQKFDRETTAVAQVIIRCVDHGKPSRTVFKSLRIPVEDVNDHKPVFSPSSYELTLPEDVPLGQAVQTVTATDKDGGPNGIIRYSIDVAGARHFKIDKILGIIYLNSSLDRETNSRLEFNVWASDGGKPPLSVLAPVRIYLTDVNDNPPALISPKSIKVVENSSVGIELGKVRFRDPDNGRNGTVQFKLIRDSNIALRYLNMTADGRVVVIAPIDREETPKMFLDVAAHDLGRPQQNMVARIVVDVLDLNDNTPRLKSPSNLTVLGFSPPLYADSPFNTTVVTVRAHDGDNKQNGTVYFSIVDTNATGMFRIHPTRGRLYSAWSYPSQPGHGLYHVVIRLSDGARPPRWSDASLMISVAPPTGNLGALRIQGFSNVVILVLIVVCSVAISAALVIAICWARSRSKRPPSTVARSASGADYLDFDQRSRLQVGIPCAPNDLDSEAMSNAELVATSTDPMVESGIHTLTRGNRPLSRLSQIDYNSPYPLTATIRSNHTNPLSFEPGGQYHLSVV